MLRTNTEVSATEGFPYKLISPKGTLLGVLTVPPRVASALEQRGYCELVFIEPLPLSPRDAEATVSTKYDIVSIRTSVQWRSRDGVELRGCTIEKIEAQPGFSFAPSAGYLRSLME